MQVFPTVAPRLHDLTHQGSPQHPTNSEEARPGRILPVPLLRAPPSLVHLPFTLIPCWVPTTQSKDSPAFFTTASSEHSSTVHQELTPWHLCASARDNSSTKSLHSPPSTRKASSLSYGMIFMAEAMWEQGVDQPSSCLQNSLCQQQAGSLCQCTGGVAADRADKAAELDTYAKCSLLYSGAIDARAHLPRVGATVRWPMLPPYG